MLLALVTTVAAAQSAPALQADGAETIAEVRVHGNHTTPDPVVLQIAGVSVGDRLSETTIREAEHRLRASGRFDAAEVRKRYRSLTRLDEVALVIVVRERPVPEDPASPTPAAVRPFRRLLASGMVLPILDYTDGYGFTYGGRVSFVHVLGRDGRVSVPLTWGATRRAAVEIDKRIGLGPFDRLLGGIETWRRENPFYERAERRSRAWVGTSGPIVGRLRGAVRATLADVRFAGVEERLSTFGADVSVDTRQDPVFPRDAVFARAGWEALRPQVSGRANRWTAEARGYLGLIGQSVLSARWQYVGSDGRLPLYERPLLGGAGSVRGYPAGIDSGDNLLAVSAELRVPLGSPLRITKAGVSVFVDGGSAWDHGTRAAGVPWRTGGGAGVFFLASLFQVSADVAVREGGGVRVHFSTGLQF